MAETGEPVGRLRVTVAVCMEARTVREWCGELPVGAQVVDALRSAGCEVEGIDSTAGIWGKAAPFTQLLREGDRVESYRPLRVDPKVARRERFARQGARSAGLFAHKPAAQG